MFDFLLHRRWNRLGDFSFPVDLLINNIGIGFRMAGPTDSCAFLSDYSLVYSSLLMIFGRLEFLAVLSDDGARVLEQRK